MPGGFARIGFSVLICAVYARESNIKLLMCVVYVRQVHDRVRCHTVCTLM